LHAPWSEDAVDSDFNDETGLVAYCRDHHRSVASSGRAAVSRLEIWSPEKACTSKSPDSSVPFSKLVGIAPRTGLVRVESFDPRTDVAEFVCGAKALNADPFELFSVGHGGNIKMTWTVLTNVMDGARPQYPTESMEYPPGLWKTYDHSAEARKAR